MNRKAVHIFGGGTVAHIASHLALTAPAYGTTASQLDALCRHRFPDMDVCREPTKMAGGHMETNEDVAARIEELKADSRTKVIFFSCALVDWDPKNIVARPANPRQLAASIAAGGKHRFRLETRGVDKLDITIIPAAKVVSTIRGGDSHRKDIFLVAFKTTCGASRQEMYEKGLRLCKEASANLVLVNDVQTRWNMIVTPEEAAYHETDNRAEVLRNLVDMAYWRSHLTFTRSTVVAGDPVPWSDPRVPDSLRKAVEHCIAADAYKPFGESHSTVGHFAVRLSETEFLTSIRRSNFNDLAKVGLVYVKTDGPDTVLAYGAKPSVGGQSQRMIFRDHPGYDCVLHFHSPLRADHPDAIPVRSQREVECGSHQCGQNTSDGLAKFGNLKVVMLDNHGPNIVFPKDIDPREVIEFVDRNFDLSLKTGGYNLK